MTTKNADKLYRHTPLVVGHRGASHDAPENTLAAFTLARQMGADGIELDTQLSKDGSLVVIHDLVLDTTTNGTGPVNQQPLSALKELDAGSHFDHSFRSERIPTLGEAVETLGPEMMINIEIKTPSWRSDGAERAVYAVIKHHNLTGGVVVSSFNPIALRRFRAIAPEIPIGYLYASDQPFYLRYGWLMLGVSHEARHPVHTMIDKAYMSWAKAHQYRVNTWTVDDPDRILQLRDLGVDAVITNRPDVALATLGRVPSQRATP